MQEQHIIFQSGSTVTMKTLPDSFPENAVIWSDVYLDEKEFPNMLTALKIPFSSFRKSLIPRRFLGVSAGEGYVLLCLPVRRSWKQVEPEYITFILQDRHVYTLCMGEGYGFEAVRQEFGNSAAVGFINEAELLVFLLETIITWNIRCYIEVRDVADELASHIDMSGRAVEERRLLHIRHQINRLAGQFENQFYDLSGLHLLIPHPRIPASMRFKLQDIRDSQSQLLHNLVRIELRVKDIQEYCRYLLQQKTDQRLRQLTVLSAVFMPLTLITGIYGMNFSEMPETRWKYGYFVVLGGMALLSAVLLYIFKKHDWFK